MANLYNYSMKFSAKDLIKLLISREGLTQKKLASIIEGTIGKKYTADGLSRKLNRGTITYNEVAMIADILGYEIKIEPKRET